MWQAEVLQRQGSWVRRFTDSTTATDWIESRIQADRDSVNPVKDSAIHNLDRREVLLPPSPPPLPFDEGGWNP